MSLQPKGPGARPGFATLSLDYPMSLGTFDKYEDAQKAVDTLSDNGLPGRELPHRRHGPQAGRARHGAADMGPGRPRGVLSGLWLGLFVGLIFSLFNPPTSAFALLLGVRSLGCPLRSHLVAGRVCLHAWHARLLLREPGRGDQVRGLHRAQVRPAGARDPRGGRHPLERDGRLRRAGTPSPTEVPPPPPA